MGERLVRDGDAQVWEHTVAAPYTHSVGPGTARFLAALRDERVILGRTCPGCELVVVPGGDHCGRCGTALGRWHEVGPAGTLTGLTAVGPDPAGSGYGRIRLDGADTDLLHRVAAPGRLSRGDRVRPVWAEARAGSIADIRHFAAAEEVAEEPEAAAPDEAAPVEVVERELRLPYRHSAGALVTRFRDGLREGRIHGNRCPECGDVLVPPRPFCARCWVPCGGWERVADEGAVVSHVVVNVPFRGQEVDIPYVLANIRLDGADTTIFHLVGRSDDGRLVAPAVEVHAGLRVRAVWRDPDDRRGLLNDDIDHFAPL